MKERIIKIMKKGLQVHYNGHHETSGWWIIIWKPGRKTVYHPFGELWVNEEQTSDPSPTKSSINRCLRLLARINNEEK